MACNKRKHPNRMRAIAAAVRLSRNNVPLRVYFCETCKSYHLTKRPKWDREEVSA